jgi:hypothetical protein
MLKEGVVTGGIVCVLEKEFVVLPRGFVSWELATVMSCFADGLVSWCAIAALF